MVKKEILLPNNVTELPYSIKYKYAIILLLIL